MARRVPMVLAQYYNFVRFGKAGYRRVMEIMQEHAESLARDIEAIGKFQIVGVGEDTLPPNAQDVKMMRALVKLNLSRSLVDTLHEDIADAISSLEEKGPVTESE